MLDVSGIDALGRTPLIDIKPYLSMFDGIEGVGNGWVGFQKVRPLAGSR